MGDNEKCSFSSLKLKNFEITNELNKCKEKKWKICFSLSKLKNLEITKKLNKK